MDKPGTQSDLPASVDSPDYFLGGLFSSAMLVLCGLLGVIFLLDALRTHDWPSLLLKAIPLGLFALTGLTLLIKGRVGLWLMYVWFGAFALSYISIFQNALVFRTTDAIFHAEFDGILLLLWACVVKYFFNRRKQFTTWLGSPAKYRPATNENEG